MVLTEINCGLPGQPAFVSTPLSGGRCVRQPWGPGSEGQTLRPLPSDGELECWGVG